MTDQSPVVEKKSSNKRNILFIVIAIVLVGGAFAFAFWPTSDKQAYFEAEITTYEWVKEQAEKRFTNELSWAEKVEQTPTETTLELSPHYEDSTAFGGFDETEEIINQSTLTINSQSDMDKEQLSLDLSADVAGLNFSDFNIFLESDQLLVDLPFLPEPLKIESEDLGTLLYEIDPFTFDEDREYNFSRIFDQENYPIPKKDQEYLKDKYSKLVYDLLPEEAFEQSSEEIKIDGESSKTDRIDFQLTEEETIAFIDAYVTEIQEDERLDEIIETYFENNFLSSEEKAQFQAEFDEGLSELKDGLEDINLPDGIRSTIWVKNDLIAQREFSIGLADGFDDKVTIEVKGTNVLAEDNQTFEYEVIVEEGGFTESLNFDVDLTIDDTKINDEIALSFDDIQLIYEAEETLDGNERDFDRTFTILAPDIDGELIWTGDSTYEEDQMSSHHEVYLEAYDLGGLEVGLILDIDSKQIKEVEPIDSSGAKDIGKMSEQELEQYFMLEVAEHFEQWIMENFGMGMGGMSEF